MSASLLPNRSAIRASGTIDPSIGLSFSGAGIVTQQSAILKQTSETANFQAPALSNQDPVANQDFLAAGLLPGASINEAGFSGGLLSPLDPPGVASSLSPEQSGTEVNAEGVTGDTLLPSDCDTTLSNVYCVYTVEQGDTLSAIANRFGLTSTEDFASYELLVRSNSPDIVNADDPLQPGQKIRVPLHNGVLHTVLTAQTLTEIADQYGVSIEAIMAVVDNGISDPDAVGIGTEILIPNPTRFAPIFVPDEAVGGGNDSASSGDVDGSSSNDGASSVPEITGGSASSAAGFIWPAGGPISSYYGPNHPLGIDIDLFNNGGAPISAAMGGVVTFAGGNACCSYGYYVVVDHGNGYQTLYAHLSSIGVSSGEVVAQGQYLGAGGTTGYSTGDHLHFELQSGGSRVNPLNYLP